MSKKDKWIKGNLENYGEFPVNYTLYFSRYGAKIALPFDDNPELELKQVPGYVVNDTYHVDYDVYEVDRNNDIVLTKQSKWMSFSSQEISRLHIESHGIVVFVETGTRFYRRLADEIAKADVNKLFEI